MLENSHSQQFCVYRVSLVIRVRMWSRLTPQQRASASDGGHGNKQYAVEDCEKEERSAGSPAVEQRPTQFCKQ